MVLRPNCLHLCLEYLGILLELVHVCFLCRPANAETFLLVWFGNLDLLDLRVSEPASTDGHTR